MRLRNGKILVKMVHPRNTPLPQNNALENEQLVSLMVGTTKNTNPIGNNELVFNPVASVTSMPRVMFALPVATSIPTTLRPTSVSLVDPRPSYVSNFTISQVSRDFFYGILTPIMSILQSNTSMFVDNNTMITSHLNPYMVPGSAISHPSRATQHGGTAFVPLNVFALTINSMLSIRQQIDESNHEIVNMLTQQIGTMFNS